MKTAHRKAAQAKRQQRETPPDMPALSGFGITFDIYQGRAPQAHWDAAEGAFHMTTKDEALNMALDALEYSHNALAEIAEAHGMSSRKAKEGGPAWRVLQAIAACREALAQKYEQEPFGYFNNPNLDDWQSCAETDDGAIALYEHPKEPLTDGEYERAYEHARTTFRHHKTSIKGQQITHADSFDWHLFCAIERAHGIGEQK